MQSQPLSYQYSRSRSHYKGIEFTIEFDVPSTAPEPFKDIHVSLNKMVCKPYDLATETQGQGYTLRSWDLALNFLSPPYLLNPFNNIRLTSHKCSP